MVRERGGNEWRQAVATPGGAPFYFDESFVGGEGDTVFQGEGGDGFAGGVEGFDAEFAGGGGEIHEEMAAGKFQRARGESAAGGIGVERREPIAAQGGEAGGADVGGVHGAAGAVEIQLVADDHAAAADGLHVTGVPGLRVVADGEEAFAVGAVPVEAVAREAGEDFVAFVDAEFGAGFVVGALPDGEEADEQAFVGEDIEVVELRFVMAEAQVGMAGIEAVGGDPRLEVAGV